MTVDLHCAVCGRRFEPDDDHVYIEAERKRINDRNDVDEYAFHMQCWDRLTGGWMDPA